MSISLKKTLSHLKRGEHWIWPILLNGFQPTLRLHAVLMCIWITPFLSIRYMLESASSFQWTCPCQLIYFTFIPCYLTVTFIYLFKYAWLRSWKPLNSCHLWNRICVLNCLFLKTSSSNHFHFTDPLVFCLQFFHDGDFPHWFGIYDINAHASQRLCKICSGGWRSRDSGNKHLILSFFACLIGACFSCYVIICTACFWVLRSSEIVFIETESKSYPTFSSLIILDSFFFFFVFFF